MIAEGDIPFLEAAFKKYYFDHFDLVGVPERTREREFGYQNFNSGMIRHISLADDRALRLLLMNNSPSDVYCSNGYYSFPELPMADKDWKEADLIFDIDAKDLGLPCRAEHTCSRCTGCRHAFTGGGSCPGCGSNRTESKSFPCGTCIKAAKREAGKLSGILTDDLGVAPEDITAYFSGNEGFHIQVSGTAYRELGSRERTELSDYIMFKNILPETLGMRRGGTDRKGLPEFDETGWRGRAAAALFGSRSARSKAITGIIAGGYPAFQDRLLGIAPRIGAVIDPNVTVDIHRIFRLSGTLNGKSGLAKMRPADLDRFDPYSEACLIDDSQTEITADCPVRFSLRGRRFGPYGGGGGNGGNNGKGGGGGQRVKVPKYAAVYLICKGFATTCAT